MDYPNGLLNWTTLNWTTPKNNNPNGYYLMFLAASIIKLHKTSAYVCPVQLLQGSFFIIYEKLKIDFFINYEKTALQIFFLLCKDVLW